MFGPLHSKSAVLFLLLFLTNKKMILCLPVRHCLNARTQKHGGTVPVCCFQAADVVLPGAKSTEKSLVFTFQAVENWGPLNMLCCQALKTLRGPELSAFRKLQIRDISSWRHLL